MVNNLISGISKALQDAYGYKVYTNAAKEELERPYFLIQHVTSNRSQKMGMRYEQSEAFDVQYFPNTDENMEECMKVKQRLYDVLEFIHTDDGKYLAGNMKGEVRDGVLHFLLEFKFFVFKTNKGADMMDTISVAVSKKEE